MANKRLAVPSKESQLVIVGPRDSFKASRIQRMAINTENPSTTVNEIGNNSHVGDVKGQPNVTLTFSAMDVGIKIFSALTGTDATSYPAAGVDISNLGEIDAIVYVKDASVSDYVKCAHARRLQVRDFAFSYSVDGESTEDYTAVGSEKRFFSKDVVVDKFTTGTTSFTLSQTPIVLKNGNYALSAVLDGTYLTEVSTAPTTGEYRIVGTTLTTGASRTSQLLVVYQADPAGNNWAYVSDGTLPVAVKGRDVGVKISANSMPRVQSLTINGSLATAPVNEMGNRNTVGYTKDVPEVTGTIAVLDTDLELVSLLQYGVTASGTEYTPGEGCVVSGVALQVELYDPCDTTSPYDVLKTVYIDSITVTGDSFTATVGQNTTYNVNFKSTYAHCVVYSGSR